VGAGAAFALPAAAAPGRASDAAAEGAVPFGRGHPAPLLAFAPGLEAGAFEVAFATGGMSGAGSGNQGPGPLGMNCLKEVQGVPRLGPECDQII